MAVILDSCMIYNLWKYNWKYDLFVVYPTYWEIDFVITCRHTIYIRHSCKSRPLVFSLSRACVRLSLSLFSYMHSTPSNQKSHSVSPIQMQIGNKYHNMVHASFRLHLHCDNDFAVGFIADTRYFITFSMDLSSFLK